MGTVLCSSCTERSTVSTLSTYSLYTLVASEVHNILRIYSLLPPSIIHFKYECTPVDTPICTPPQRGKPVRHQEHQSTTPSSARYLQGLSITGSFDQPESWAGSAGDYSVRGNRSSPLLADVVDSTVHSDWLDLVDSLLDLLLYHSVTTPRGNLDVYTSSRLHI